MNAISMIITLLVLAIILLLLWPGLRARIGWGKWRTDRDRILIEDALKHIFQCERRNITCSFKSLAGALSVSEDQVAIIITRLEQMKLLDTFAGDFKLTAEGKDYALHIIRVHRLWERYLADETGIPEENWHAEAEKQEHLMTAEEADAVSVQLGNPVYDPHGDPIPTAKGELPPVQGIPLTRLEAGKTAGIIHIEDEPHAVYKEILVHGFELGARVEIVESKGSEIRVRLNNKTLSVNQLVANNITVEPLTDIRPLTDLDSLYFLKQGEKGQVVQISRAVRGQQRRRLMDLGVVPGSVIIREMTSASGDPRAYNIRGAIIALRNDQAKQIQISRI